MRSPEVRLAPADRLERICTNLTRSSPGVTWLVSAVAGFKVGEAGGELSMLCLTKEDGSRGAPLSCAHPA